MLESFLGTLSPMLMLFICIVIGYILNKMKLLTQDAATVLSRLEKYVFLPAMGFSTFSKYCTVASIRDNIDIIPYSLGLIVLAVTISIPLSKAFEKNDINKRNIYKYALVFANHGFMGNAVVPLILGGQEHLYKYLLFTLPLNVLTYLWGIGILTPKEYKTGGAVKNLVNAPMIGMLLGMIVGLTNTQKFVPGFVATTVDSLQSCMGPVAMLLTGFVVADYSFGELLSDKKIYIATFLRLIVLPTLFLGALIMCGASKYVTTLALFAYATPLGLNTVVFPASFGGDTKTGAGMAMISHALCVLTIPVMYVVLQSIVG